MTNEKLIQLVEGENLRHAGSVPTNIILNAPQNGKSSFPFSLDQEYDKAVKDGDMDAAQENELRFSLGEAEKDPGNAVIREDFRRGLGRVDFETEEEMDDYNRLLDKAVEEAYLSYSL